MVIPQGVVQLMQEAKVTPQAAAPFSQIDAAATEPLQLRSDSLHLVKGGQSLSPSLVWSVRLCGRLVQFLWGSYPMSSPGATGWGRGARFTCGCNLPTIPLSPLGCPANERYQTTCMVSELSFVRAATNSYALSPHSTYLYDPIGSVAFGSEFAYYFCLSKH